MNEHQESPEVREDVLLPDGWTEDEDLFAPPAPPEQPSDSTEPKSDADGADGSDTPGGGEAVPVPADTERVVRDVRTARQLYPELRGLPEEILLAVAGGESFLNACAVYRAKTARQEVERLRQENETLRQNQDAAARAPVRGVSGGGNAASRPVSDFERGFDADGW